MRVLKILSFVCLALSLTMCGNKNDNSNESTTSPLWDAESVQFDMSYVGGTGPEPSSSFEIKCQLGKRNYRFGAGILEKIVCSNPTEGYVDFRKELSDAEIGELHIILGSVQFSKKTHSGRPCFQDGGGHPGGFIQIYQANETVKIIDTNTEEQCGTNKEGYMHGYIENFDFLNQLDILLD